MTNNEVYFLEALLPFGSLDLDRAKTICDEADIDYVDLGEYIEQYCSDSGTDFKNIDVVGIVYELIRERAIAEVPELENADVIVFGNYLDSSYDNIDEAKAILDKLAESPDATILDDSITINWFYRNL